MSDLSSTVLAGHKGSLSGLNIFAADVESQAAASARPKMVSSLPLTVSEITSLGSRQKHRQLHVSPSTRPPEWSALSSRALHDLQRQNHEDHSNAANDLS